MPVNHVKLTAALPENELDNYDYVFEHYMGISYLINRYTLEKISFDYILISSVRQEEIKDRLHILGIPNEKQCLYYMSDLEHIGFWQYHALKCDSFSDLVMKFEKSNNIDTLIVGTSYHKLGIDSFGFSQKNIFNFSLAGQDIFFNYEIIKFLFDNYPEKMKNVNAVIIGLCHYSLEYDFSKSINKLWIVRYYPYLASAHNMMLEKQWRILGKKLLFEVNSHNLTYSWFEPAKNEKGHSDCNFTEQEAKQSATNDCHKDYPFTVVKNKVLLSDFADYLKKHNVSLIGLVMPVSKFYRKYINDKMLADFRSFIGELNLHCLDYFDMDMPDDYFADPSHLWKKGAMIFSPKLEHDLLRIL